jgi:hypothetical protein
MQLSHTRPVAAARFDLAETARGSQDDDAGTDTDA